MRIFRGVIESSLPPSTDMLWLCNNELKYFSRGEWKIINKKFSILENKEISNYIELEEGNSKNIKESNLSKLKEINGTFLLKSKYGYGVGIWNQDKGGQIHIITPYGSDIYYTINKNGALGNMTESPNIYIEYINSGGTKNYKQFIQKLITLLK